jgi:hypothetical protein
METLFFIGGLVFIALIAWSWIERGKRVVRAAKGEASERPDDALLHSIEQIGQSKNALGESFRGCLNALGLYVQLRQVPKGAFPQSASSVDKSLDERGGWVIQAGEQLISHVDAYRLEGEPRWHVVKYQPGKWEKAVKPTLELAQFLPGYIAEAGDAAKVANVIMGVGRRFQKTGQLKLTFSQQEEDELEMLGRQANAERLQQLTS